MWINLSKKLEMYALALDGSKLALNNLKIIVNLLYTIPNRDPEAVKSVHITGRDVIEKIKSFYEEKMRNFKEYPINERIELLRKTEKELVFFEVDPYSLTKNNLTPANKLSTSLVMEIVVLGNLYMCDSLLRQHLEGRCAKKLQKRLMLTIQRNERIFRRVEAKIEDEIKRGKIRERDIVWRKNELLGRYGIRRDASGIAQYHYALETLVNNPLEELEKRNYLSFYGKAGIHFEVKNARVLTKEGSKAICDVHKPYIEAALTPSILDAVRKIFFNEIQSFYEVRRISYFR